MLLKFSGRLREALRPRDQLFVFEKSSGRSEAEPEHLYLRARALLRAGDMPITISLLQQACELDPTFSDAIESQGEALDRLGDSAAAVAKYDLARRIRRRARLGAPDRHFVWRQQKRSAAEILAYTSVIKSMRRHALPYLARGNAYLVGGQSELALADFQRALKLQPASLDALALKGEALVGMGRYHDAMKLFDRVLSARPADFDALNSRGIARMAAGRIEDANADWKRQLEVLAGKSAPSAYIALRMADYDTSLPHLMRALRANGSDSYWNLYASAASLRLGRPLLAGAMEDGDSWPALLTALLNGRATADEVLARADTPSRQGEAQFQLGILAFDRDRASARRHWQQVVEVCPPTLVEYAAARNELARPGI